MSIQVCPTCGTAISLVKAREIEQHLNKERTELEAVVAKEVEAKHRCEVQAATQATEKRLRDDANKRVAAVTAERDRLQQKALQLEATRRREIEAATQAAEKRSREDANKRIAGIVAERDKLQLKAAQLEAREMAVKKQVQDEAERRIKLAQGESDRRAKKDILEQRRILEKHNDGELLKQQAVFNREREAYQKTVRDMERRLERKNPNELGDGAEIDLYEALREAFPDDSIKRIQKGKAGVDILHEVRQRNQCCGRIVYDSKNHQSWRTEFVTKLRHDQKEAEAEYALLSTSQFPKGEKGICVQGGVIIISPANVVQVVGVLRSSMIKVHQLGLSGKEREGKIGQLYTFITSQKFTQRLAIATQVTSQMEELDVQEKKSHDNVWKQRGLLNRRLAGVVAEIDTEISAILEGVDMRPAA